MKKELKLLIDDSTGRITDDRGMEYFLPQTEEEAMKGNKNFRIEENLDMSGSITLTGNLTVQQSQWVYLRGPITSSGILINGSITGSNLWIRDRTGGAEHQMEGMGYGIFDRDVIIGGESVKESMDRTRSFGEVEGMVGGMSGKIEWLEGRIEDLKAGLNDRDADIQIGALRGRVERVEKEVVEAVNKLRAIEDDVKIIMSIIHK